MKLYEIEKITTKVKFGMGWTVGHMQVLLLSWKSLQGSVYIERLTRFGITGWNFLNFTIFCPKNLQKIENIAQNGIKFKPL